MAFSFRIRFHLGPGLRIGSAETTLPLPPRREGEEVVLRGTDREKPIRENAELLVHGGPYASEEEASRAGAEWVGLIKKAFARRNLGADFGDRSPQGFVTKHGLKLLSRKAGAQSRE